jgi:hypothetical protein
MPDQGTSETISEDFADAAQQSRDAGIADESAAYTNANNRSASASDDERDVTTANDRSGTSKSD